MKDLGFYNYYNEYNSNNLFNPLFKSYIGDDLTYPFRYLAEEANKKNIKVSTIDTKPLDCYDAIVFLDFPTFQNQYFKELIEKKSSNLYLFIFENELNRFDNWEKKNYRYFKKVYSWNDEIVDNKKIFKFFIPNKIPKIPLFDLSQKNFFCCMIAGKKTSNHKLELYQERIRAIRWFEKNAPHHFDLYGLGWDTSSFSGIVASLNMFPLIKNIFATKYSSFKGAIPSKEIILKKYKFSICYENARDIPGYITEKIFDCFFAGCVPIYLGAPNVTDFIPEETFIDKRNYKTYPELYDYLKKMTDEEYFDYLQNIKNFITSDKIYPFSAEYFSQTVLGIVE